LLDIRVRSGAISRDHRRRFEALDVLLDKYASKLRRHPRGMAYVRAAVFAFRAGEDDFAQRWTQLARQAGLKRLLADSYGRRLLGWGVLGAPQRKILRYGNSVLRSLIGRAIREVGAIKR
jgi:hypothetical protein